MNTFPRLGAFVLASALSGATLALTVAELVPTRIRPQLAWWCASLAAVALGFQYVAYRRYVREMRASIAASKEQIRQSQEWIDEATAAMHERRRTRARAQDEGLL